MAASSGIAAPSLFAVLDGHDSAGDAWLQVSRKPRKVKASLVPPQPLTGTPAAQPFDYYAVLDFECTCERGDSWWVHEIIDFPVVFVNARSRQVEFEFHLFVRPTERSKLTEFCTELTGIAQDNVDSASTLPIVLNQLYLFLQQHKLTFSTATSPPLTASSASFSCCWVCDGQSDFEHFLHAEVSRKRLFTPPLLFSHYCDIRLAYASYHPHCTRPHLRGMLREMGLRFVGRPHSGLDDARNVASLLIELINRGAVVNCNSQLPAD